MKFEDFERLEKFNILTKDIEELQIQKSKSSSTGHPTEKGGLVIKRDGTYKRE